MRIKLFSIPEELEDLFVRTNSIAKPFFGKPVLSISDFSLIAKPFFSKNTRLGLSIGENSLIDKPFCVQQVF